MATIDELLNGPTPIEDIDEVLSIDPVARQVIVPSDELVLGVADDVNSECKYFKMPRKVGNINDVTECSLRVNYKNINADTDGYFPVTNWVSDDTSVVFCWEVSPNVTVAAGDVEFSIAVCRTIDGMLHQEWQTTPTTGKVLRGLRAVNTEETLSRADVIALAEEAAKRAEAAAKRAEAASGSTLDASGISVTDRTTGKVYSIFVNGGRLSMMEVE